jgi:hypothetical protein
MSESKIRWTYDQDYPDFLFGHPRGEYLSGYRYLIRQVWIGETMLYRLSGPKLGQIVEFLRLETAKLFAEETELINGLIKIEKYKETHREKLEWEMNGD